MAGVMAQCGGLECMLNRLSGIKDFKQGRHLLTVRKLNNKTVIFISLVIVLAAVYNYLSYMIKVCIESKFQALVPISVALL